MDQRKVLIISENTTDHLILSSCLERAQPQRFQLTTAESTEKPLEALMDPGHDVVIISYAPETEYLLRLAQKNNPILPIIVLHDEMQDDIIAQLREYGAQDYLIRGQLQDELVHRILDYNIQLKDAREQIQQLSNRDTLTGALNRTGADMTGLRTSQACMLSGQELTSTVCASLSKVLPPPLISAPVQNTLPAPVNTATRMASSSSQRR